MLVDTQQVIMIMRIAIDVGDPSPDQTLAVPETELITIMVRAGVCLEF